MTRGDDLLIDDHNDPEPEEGEDPIYAVLRPRRCKSGLLVNLIN